MVTFDAVLEKFGKMGEKTGWTYVRIPKKIANKIKPDTKKSFRVKGKIDEHAIAAVAMVPMGEGDFIIAVNAPMRKAIGKIHGAAVTIQLEEDDDKLKISSELLECLKDDPAAENFFMALPMSHKNWFSNWVTSAKADATKSKRISTIIKACGLQMGFQEMMRQYKEDNNLIQ